MKRRNKALITTTILGSGLLLAGAAQVNSQEGVQEARAQNASTQIGIIQSDLIIQEYKGVEDFQEQSLTLQQDFAQAQQQGDQQKMQQIQDQFAQMQAQFQQQFDNDLKEAARKVARDKELDFIVSEVIYQSDKVTEVDLTADLIETINKD